jgi:hypothetical protein
VRWEGLIKVGAQEGGGRRGGEGGIESWVCGRIQGKDWRSMGRVEMSSDCSTIGEVYICSMGISWFGDIALFYGDVEAIRDAVDVCRVS